MHTSAVAKNGPRLSLNVFLSDLANASLKPTKKCLALTWYSLILSSISFSALSFFCTLLSKVPLINIPDQET
jgi:hypothetical protein